MVIERIDLIIHLSNEDIENMNPAANEIPLVTRLRDGNQVQLSENKISELLPKAIDLMIAKMNVKAVGVLCTHEFPKTKFAFPTIFPFDYLQFLINRVLKPRKLGVVVPLENQVEMVKKKWKKKNTVVDHLYLFFSKISQGKYLRVCKIFQHQNASLKPLS